MKTTTQIELKKKHPVEEQKKEIRRINQVSEKRDNHQVYVVDKNWLKRKAGLHSLANKKQLCDKVKTNSEKTEKLLLEDRC